MLNYEELQSKVVSAGLCSGCGACISACPNDFVAFANDKPNWNEKLKEECAWCDKCYNACYMVRRELIKDLGRFFFGRSGKNHIGVYRKVVAARTLNKEVKRFCQDGGIATSVLIHLLEGNLIEGALVVASDGWLPVVTVARTQEDLINAAGTKYGIVPILKGLKSAIREYGLRSIGIVGSPCHIQSLRYLQHAGLIEGCKVSPVIGLLCRENYEYKSVEAKVRGSGLRIEDVERFEISEEFNVWAKGEKISYPMVAAKKWVPKHCLICEDFTSELADISIGSDGSPEGWSTVIIRTEHAENILSELETKRVIEMMPLPRANELEELSQRKRKKGKQTRKIFKMAERGRDVEEIAEKLGITEERVLHRLERL